MFHILNGAGDTVHTSHAQLSRYHIDLSYSVVSATEKQSMLQVLGGDVGNGVIRTAVEACKLYPDVNLSLHSMVDTERT